MGCALEKWGQRAWSEMEYRRLSLERLKDEDDRRKAVKLAEKQRDEKLIEEAKRGST
jgi:hypothetical protein